MKRITQQVNDKLGASTLQDKSYSTLDRSRRDSPPVKRIQRMDKSVVEDESTKTRVNTEGDLDEHHTASLNSYRYGYDKAYGKHFNPYSDKSNKMLKVRKYT